jgi:hypothetical protein
MLPLLALSAALALAVPSAPAANPAGVPADAPYTLALPTGWRLVSSWPPEGELHEVVVFEKVGDGYGLRFDPDVVPRPST